MLYLLEPWSRSLTLQHAMNTAVCIVSETRKFSHGLSQILHDDLHWLDVADRVTCKLSVLLIVAHRSPMLSAGSVSGLPHNNWWWCHDIGYPLLAAKHLPCTVPWSWTLCWTTSTHSRTTSPLDGAWKPGFSVGTSVFSALETFVTIALYKFTIPCLIERALKYCYGQHTTELKES